MPVVAFIPLIAAGISAASTAIAAKKQANATKAAAATQQAGVATAKAELNALYGPQVGQAQQGMLALGNALGIPQAPNPLGSGVNYAVPKQGSRIPVQPAAAPGPSAPTPVQNRGGGGGNTQPAGTLGQMASMTTASGYGATVRMQAPDGSQKDVSEMDVPKYLQRGAQIIEGAAPTARA